MSSIFDIFKLIEKKSAPALPITHIVAGLGNPGEKYFLTRHNAGFLALDFLSQKYNEKINKVKFKSLYTDTVIGGVRTLLLKPQTYMNLSGEAVREVADYYKIPPQNIIVITDDTSFDTGRIRIKRQGSDGGHNGLKSIISALGSTDFPRIKIGIGSKPHIDYDLADWVLSSFDKKEREVLFSCFGNVQKSIELILSGNIERAMSLYNTTPT